MVDTNAILLAILPVAFILATIGPIKLAVAFLLVKYILSYVFATIGPMMLALSMHLVVLPLAIEESAIGPRVATFTVNSVLGQVSLIARTVLPVEFALSSLHVMHV